MPANDKGGRDGGTQTPLGMIGARCTRRQGEASCIMHQDQAQFKLVGDISYDWTTAP